MIGVIVTALAVIGSGLVGFAVHRFLMSGKVIALAGPLPEPEPALAGRARPMRAVGLGLRRHICAVIAIAAGLATGIGAYMALNLISQWIPVFDDPNYIRNPVPAELGVAGQGLVIELVYSPSSLIRRDFVVKVRLLRPPAGFGPGHYVAGLTGSRIVEIREDQACPADTGSPPDPHRVVSCTDIAGDPADLTFRWDVTPVESGQSNLSIRFGGGWLPPEITADASSATLTINGRSFGLAPGRSEYQFGEVALDLGDRLLRFPVEVQTSLGLSQSTYDAVMLFVGLAGCLFGSGWMFRFFDRREKKAAA